MHTSVATQLDLLIVLLFLQIWLLATNIFVFFPVNTVFIKHPQVLRLRLDFYLKQNGEEVPAVYMGLGVV